MKPPILVCGAILTSLLLQGCNEKGSLASNDESVTTASMSEDQIVGVCRKKIMSILARMGGKDRISEQTKTYEVQWSNSFDWTNREPNRFGSHKVEYINGYASAKINGMGPYPDNAGKVAVPSYCVLGESGNVISITPDVHF